MAKLLDTFQTKCLRKIKRIFWPNTIRNNDLLRETCMIPTSVHGRWRWIGHVLRMLQHSLPATSLRWTPQGKRNAGRPKETWIRTTEKMMTNRKQRNKRQRTDRYEDLLIQAAPCVLDTDGYR
jgi:hypothetical protein